jgi:hypothetical protein
MRALDSPAAAEVYTRARQARATTEIDNRASISRANRRESDSAVVESASVRPGWRRRWFTPSATRRSGTCTAKALARDLPLRVRRPCAGEPPAQSPSIGPGSLRLGSTPWSGSRSSRSRGWSCTARPSPGLETRRLPEAAGPAAWRMSARARAIHDAPHKKVASCGFVFVY